MALRRALRLTLRVAAVAGALLAAGEPSTAQGLLDFLFGSPPRRDYPPPPQPLPQQPQMSPRSPADTGGYGSVNPNQQIIGSGSGRGAAFCVRLCDGLYFPLERHDRATPAQLCSAFCPASQTKVFNGSDITHAVAADGARYGDLKTAYVYRKTLIAGCTCNGREPFGLAHIDATNDPTLRVGDAVTTGDGVTTIGRKP